MTAIAWPKKPVRSVRSGSRTVFVDATEAYLRLIYEMTEEEGNDPNRMSLCRRLNISRSAVSQQVDRMTRHGLVHVVGGRRIRLTDTGRTAATAIVRKHRLAERLLADIVGLEWELCHAEADRWQHVLGDAVERKVIAKLDDPTTSPFGNPIPGLHELDPTLPGPGPETDRRAPTLADLAAGPARRVRVCRILERLQDDDTLLHRLRDAGVRPGAVVDVVADGPGRAIRIESATGTLLLDVTAARWITAVTEAA